MTQTIKPNNNLMQDSIIESFKVYVRDSEGIKLEDYSQNGTKVRFEEIADVIIFEQFFADYSSRERSGSNCSLPDDLCPNDTTEDFSNYNNLTKNHPKLRKNSLERSSSNNNKTTTNQNNPPKIVRKIHFSPFSDARDVLYGTNKWQEFHDDHKKLSENTKNNRKIGQNGSEKSTKNFFLSIVRSKIFAINGFDSAKKLKNKSGSIAKDKNSYGNFQNNYESLQSSSIRQRKSNLPNLQRNRDKSSTEDEFSGDFLIYSGLAFMIGVLFFMYFVLL